MLINMFRSLYRNQIKIPIMDFLGLIRNTAKYTAYTSTYIVLKTAVALLLISLLIWLSVLMYLSLYINYIPTVGHTRPVHFKVGNDPHKDDESHSRLTSHVQLTKRQQLLMLGQGYEIRLGLEMPESPNNKKLGMFMVCAEFRSRLGELISRPCRASMLHYKSCITEALGALFYSPFYLFGNYEEKQNLQVELFSNYEENEGPSVTDIFIEIHSKNIELYSAKLFINADLKGVRYWMYNWPVLSAVIGIILNLLIIAIVCLLTWYQLIVSEECRKLAEEKARNPEPESPVEDISGSDMNL